MATWTRLVVVVVCSVTIPHRRVDSIQRRRPSSLLDLLGLCSYFLGRWAIYQLELNYVSSGRTDLDELFLELCILPLDLVSSIQNILPE